MQERALKFNLRGFLSLLLGVGICKKFGTHCFLSFHTGERFLPCLQEVSVFRSGTMWDIKLSNFISLIGNEMTHFLPNFGF